MDDFYQQQFDKALTTEYDNQFMKIDGMTWLPWVGKHFSNTRILIVGESHYTNKATPEEAKQGKLEYMEDIYSTRAVFAEYPMLGFKAGWKNHAGRRNNPTIDNIFRVLVSNALIREQEQPLRERLCSAFAFVNIVQRPMWYPPRTSGYAKERPNKNDIAMGWNVMKKIITILMPDLCWFAGCTASNDLQCHLEHVGLSHGEIKFHSKIGRTYPREVNVTIDNKEIPLKFSQHPSKCFSWKLWQKFLFDDKGCNVRQNLLQYMGIS